MSTSRPAVWLFGLGLVLLTGCGQRPGMPPPDRRESAAGPEPLTAIIGAYWKETTLLEQRLAGKAEHKVRGVRFLTGRLASRRVVLCNSGVGKVNAALVATLLIDRFQPDEVIFTGIAGGLDPDLLPGDIVIAEKTAQHDLGIAGPKGFAHFSLTSPTTGRKNPVFFPADQRLLRAAQSAAGRVHPEALPSTAPDGTARPPRIVTGVVVTGDMFVASDEKRDELRRRMNGDAVEMEGAAVAQVCWQFAAPAIVIRSISDFADTRAEKDVEAFAAVAGRNAAALTEQIVAELARLPAPRPPATQPVRIP